MEFVNTIRGDITAISVAGFKPFRRKAVIEFEPLTILAGANSSGKSSIMQPLLLLKQTLEAPYNPGTLLLNGPNISFTDAKQLMWRINDTRHATKFTLGFNTNTGDGIKITYLRTKKSGFKLVNAEIDEGDRAFSLQPNMKHSEIHAILPKEVKQVIKHFQGKKNDPKPIWKVLLSRCFFSIVITFAEIDSKKDDVEIVFRVPMFSPQIFSIIENHSRNLIHVPGLRGNPERTYPSTFAGETYPGLFQDYTASIIQKWQADRDDRRNTLSRQLEVMDLTWQVQAQRVTDTHVKLRVGRLPRKKGSSKKDTINIADVGLGISQVLPVLVALLTAERRQLVYLEHPELHLHPNAQFKLAKPIVDAALRGVRVVLETHSRLLLRGIQILVADKTCKINPDLIKLHWFNRCRETGVSRITTRQIKSNGSFGDWPEDFSEVAMKAESEFLEKSTD